MINKITISADISDTTKRKILHNLGVEKNITNQLTKKRNNLSHLYGLHTFVRYVSSCMRAFKPCIFSYLHALVPYDNIFLR